VSVSDLLPWLNLLLLPGVRVIWVQAMRIERLDARVQALEEVAKSRIARRSTDRTAPTTRT
jgi:hypothetical protein